MKRTRANFNLFSNSKKNGKFHFCPIFANAERFFMKGMFDQAIKIARQLIKDAPHGLEPYMLLVSALEEKGLAGEAISELDKAENYIGKSEAILTKRAELHKQELNFSEALESYEHLVMEFPSTEARRAMAQCYFNAGEHWKAERVYEALNRNGEVNLQDKYQWAELLKSEGRNEEAIKLLRTVLKDNPEAGAAYWLMANIKSYKLTDDDLDAMVNLYSSGLATPRVIVQLCLAIGKAYEDRHQFDQSFRFCQIAKELHYQLHHYDPQTIRSKFQYLKKLLRKDSYSFQFNPFFSENFHGVTPIFIVGMHRSGSTLLEQILASHSLVSGAEELPNMKWISEKLSQKYNDISMQCLRLPKALLEISLEERIILHKDYMSKTEIFRGGSPFFVDKRPDNFMLVPLIFSVIPNAKIIDARRNPLSVGVSQFRHLFSQEIGHTNRLSDIGDYYKEYIELMNHWNTLFPGRIYRVQYENIVENTEAEVRKILEYCNLDFEQSCLEFYKNNRAVKTPSREQVRQPVYEHAREYWKNYEAYLDPLKESLSDVLNTYDEELS